MRRDVVCVVLCSISLALAQGACTDRAGKADDSEVGKKPVEPESAAEASRPALTPAFEAVPRAGDEDAIEIGFAWHPPCRVPAVHASKKKGRDLVLTYDVLLVPSGEQLELRLENHRLLSADGGSALMGDPQFKLLMAMATSAVPDVVLSARGAYLGVRNLDKTLDGVARLLHTLPSELDADILERAMAMMRTPEMKATLEQKSGDTWNTWAGHWIGLELSTDTVLERVLEVPMPTGVTVETPLRTEHHGRVVGAEHLVLLSSRQLVEGPEATEAILGVMRQMAEQMGQPPPPPNAIKQIRRETTLTVAIEPATGRPHRARSVTRIRADTTEEEEIHDTAFDWSRAEGCTSR